MAGELGSKDLFGRRPYNCFKLDCRMMTLLLDLNGIPVPLKVLLS